MTVSGSENSSAYADKFWLMLNAVTAFAAAQDTAVAIGNWSRIHGNVQAISGALALVLIMSLLYTFSICRLSKTFIRLAQPAPSLLPLLKSTLRGRIVAVWLFALYAAGQLWFGFSGK